MLLRFIFALISCAFAFLPFVPLIFSASHLIFNPEDGRYDEVDDSPYLTKQPHSLHAILKQIEWVQKLSELKSSIRLQQELIEQRYDEDDPEIERKMRETDVDCIKSVDMDLQPEFFQPDYPVTLVNVQPTPEEFEGSAEEFDREIQIQTRSIFEMFQEALEVEPPLAPGQEPVEPHCDLLYKEDEEEVDELEGEEGDQQSSSDRKDEFDTLDAIRDDADANDPGFLDEGMSAEQLPRLANFLSRQFADEDRVMRKINLYMSQFYWRMRGRNKNALKCLLSFSRRIRASGAMLIPVKFQLGMVLLKLGHPLKAIEHLEFVNEFVENCAHCLMPLGDAHVMANNLAEAEKIFDRVHRLAHGHPRFDLAQKKAATIRCTQKLMEAMEKQHRNLLETIDDVEDFKARMKKIEELERKIEANRAPPEARLQAKLVYDHYEYGPLPYANCREGTSWVGNGKRRKRLYCTVSSWNRYNDSLEQKRRQRAAVREKEAAKLGPEREKQRRERAERRRQRETEEDRRQREMAKYLDGLAPFVGMAVDEPQRRPKYPLESKPNVDDLPFLRPNWPSLDECKEFEMDRDEDDDEENEGPTSKFADQLFISPQNKGYFLPDFMSKFLTLGPGELTPFPWELPLCSAYAPKNALSEKFEFIRQLHTFQRLKSGQVPPNDAQMEQELEAELLKLVDHSPSANEPMIPEIGQRIGHLMKFDIGPKWLSFNLAALYLRHYGILSEATICLEAALKCSGHKDIALTQLAQLLMRNVDWAEADRRELDGIERMLGIAMQAGIHEPIPFHLMAIFHSIQGRLASSERLLFQALQLDPGFEPSLHALMARKCTKRLVQKPRPLVDGFSPICCWPNEPDIFCFPQWNDGVKKRGKKLRKTTTTTMTTRCFRIVAQKEEPFHLDLIYFRCNQPYTGKSYPAPAYAKFIAVLLKPAADLRQKREDAMVSRLEAEWAADWEARQPVDPPVFPLDYGGYSLERIEQHQRQGWADVQLPEKMIHSWVDPEWQRQNEEEQRPKKSTEEKADEGKEAKNAPKSAKMEEKVELDLRKVPKIDPGELSRLTNRLEVATKLDIPLPKNLPMPPMELVDKGRRHIPPSLNKEALPELCQGQQQRKSGHLLEQPVSTWVSPSAKGVKVEDLVDLDAPLPSVGPEEPECPDPPLGASSPSILAELDALPGYLYRQHLPKFYRPEKALKDTFRSIGNKNQVEQVAARLSFAIKSANSADRVHWALSTLSSLYWRIRGDPVNAIKCLRHSLQMAPEKFKDVPLVSLANIYHQAGFLHSALFTLGKALETGADVVAIHFTLANLYSTIGNFPHALHFYHSTLALQSNFEPAKVRIVSIHCATQGELLEQ